MWHSIAQEWYDEHRNYADSIEAHKFHLLELKKAFNYRRRKNNKKNKKLKK